MNSGLLFSSFKVKHAEPLIRFHEKNLMLSKIFKKLGENKAYEELVIP
jgi:hypothetical protein